MLYFNQVRQLWEFHVSSVSVRENRWRPARGLRLFSAYAGNEKRGWSASWWTEEESEIWVQPLDLKKLLKAVPLWQLYWSNVCDLFRGQPWEKHYSETAFHIKSCRKFMDMITVWPLVSIYKSISVSPRRDWHGNVHDNVNVFVLGGIEQVPRLATVITSTTCCCKHVRNTAAAHITWITPHSIHDHPIADLYTKCTANCYH